MKRWWTLWLVVGLALLIALAGCGGGENKTNGDEVNGTGANSPAPGDGQDGGAPTSPPSPRPPTLTPVPPSPRSRSLPVGEPYDFEAPFSVGTYVRQRIQGHANSTQTGGQQATYQHESGAIALTVYAFDTIEAAQATVQFTLAGANIVAIIGEPYTAPTVAFGVAQDRHGGHVAAWSHYEWCFLVRTPGSLDDLTAFLDLFPY